MPPYAEKVHLSALNTQQVEKTLVLGVGSAEAGEAAYNGYLESCGGKSLVSGAPLPTWVDQAPEIQKAWRAAAQAAGLYLGAINLSTRAG